MIHNECNCSPFFAPLIPNSVLITIIWVSALG